MAVLLDSLDSRADALRATGFRVVGPGSWKTYRHPPHHPLWTVETDPEEA